MNSTIDTIVAPTGKSETGWFIATTCFLPEAQGKCLASLKNGLKANQFERDSIWNRTKH